MAGYNPVSGRTRVVTKELGNVAISDLSGGVYHVLNKDGMWTKASFKSYGKQAIKIVNLKLNSNTEKFVEATENHRWVLQNGEIVSTSSLQKGDRIDFVYRGLNAGFKIVLKVFQAGRGGVEGLSEPNGGGHQGTALGVP